jgi:hypothetical protein
VVSQLNTFDATIPTLLVDHSEFNYPIDAFRSGSRSTSASEPRQVRDREIPTSERGDLIVNDKRSRYAVGIVSGDPDLAEESARTR